MRSNRTVAILLLAISLLAIAMAILIDLTTSTGISQGMLTHLSTVNFTLPIRDIRFDGTVHNNKMERMNGEIRDRERVMRGLEKKDTPILTGYQLFHNYIRPHEALKGKTPAEAAGVQIKGENKWLTIIQNASRKHDSEKCYEHKAS